LRAEAAGRAAAPPAEPDVRGDRALIDVAFARLDPLALALACAAVFGLALWTATAVLLLRGGVWVGMHLGRLSNYLPGYDVSWSGAFVGLFEGACIGLAVGAVLAWLWNLYHRAFLALVMAREARRELTEL
jgi:hypothetical protein